MPALRQRMNRGSTAIRRLGAAIVSGLNPASFTERLKEDDPMRTFSIAGSFLLTGFFIAAAFVLAAAQQPTEAERDAIRSACRSDFIAHCASVEPGGKEALECLLQNNSNLSAPCKSALNAVSPQREPATREAAPASSEPPTAGAAKPMAAQTQDQQIKAIRRSCTLDDFMTHCSWIQPSSPEVVLC